VESGTFLIGTVCVLVSILAFAGSASAVPTPYANGNVFNETFDGGVFSEAGSSFAGDIGGAVSFDNDAAMFVNNNMTGEYAGDFTVISTTSEYVIEVVVNVSSAFPITENAYVMSPADPIWVPGDLKLEAKEAPGGTWDIEIADAVGATMAGLTLAKDTYHYVAQHHRGNPAGDVDLYVDGSYVGTYTDRDRTQDIRYVRVGNVSGEAGVGFGTAHFDSVLVGTVPPPEPPLSLGRSDGSIFYETFNGGAFSETGSVFAGDGVGTSVSFDSDAAMFVNYKNGKTGEYHADVGTVSTDSEYVIEVLVNISSAWDITENAFVVQPYSPLWAVEVDLKMEAKEKGDPNGVMWDLEIVDASGAAMAGLSLTKNAYHYISQRHLGNVAGDVELYVDGSYIGTYTDRDKNEDFQYLQIGNVSGVADVGFGFAWFSSVSVGNLGTPPAPQCGDSGTVYLQSDLSRDCRVNLPDFAILASEWFYCTDPADPNCDQYLPLASP